MKKLFRITTVPISVEKLLGEQLSFMNKHFQVTAISSDKKELKRVCDNLGVKFHVVEMTRKITPFQDLRSLWKMYRYIKKEKPDIVHTHTPKAGLIGMIAAKMAGVKLRLHTVAGLPLMETTGIKRNILDLVEKLTYSCATKVYPNSKGLYNFILENKYTTAYKLKVIAHGSSNGINTDFFDPRHFTLEQKENIRKELGISQEDFLFTFVGRLVGDKGINELIQAFSNFSIQLSNVKLLLVGPLETDLDPLQDETLKIIVSDKNIISMGYQQDVRSFFAVSDALVFPSYREGFPNVVMQAGAMGLPSIVTDINGCNEIIIDNENGLIVPPKDIKTLEKAMLDLVQNKELYNKLKTSARERILSRYEQSLVWKSILEEYHQLSQQARK